MSPTGIQHVSLSQDRTIIPEPSSSSSPPPLDPTSTSPSSPALARDVIPAVTIAAALTAPFHAAKSITTGGDREVTGVGNSILDSFNSVDSPIESMKQVLGTQEKWNTRHLSQRIGGDIMSAAAAGGCVAPIITAIDRAIIENASNRNSLRTSLTNSLRSMAFTPHIFLTSRPFLLIFTLYTGTYLSANTLDTVTSTFSNRPASSTTSGTSKFAATSAANLSLCLYKDSQFTRMFGAAKAGKVPGTTYALFAVRDMLTIFASFNLPPLLAPHMPLSQGMEKYVSQMSTAQFLAPAAVQIASTPLHLLGLDLYNRPNAKGDVSVASRMAKVVKDWAPSCAFRIARIVPAFGVGGVVNTNVRKRMLGGLE